MMGVSTHRRRWSWWGDLKWAMGTMDWTRGAWATLTHTHTLPLTHKQVFFLIRTQNIDWWEKNVPPLIHALRQAVALFFILSYNFISLGSIIDCCPAVSFGGLNTMNDEWWAQYTVCQGVEQQWSKETEALTKAPIHTQIIPPQASDEIWTYVFAITIHSVLSSLLCRQLVWLGSVQ